MEFEDENEYGQEGEGLEEAYPERGGAMVPAGGASSALAHAVQAERMLAPHNIHRVCVPIETHVAVDSLGPVSVDILDSVMLSLSSKKEGKHLLGKSFFVLAAGYGGALTSTNAPYPIHVRTGIRAADTILPGAAKELAVFKGDKTVIKPHRKMAKALNTFTFSIAPNTNTHLAKTRHFYCPVPHPNAEEKLEAYAPELTGRSIWGDSADKTHIFVVDASGRKVKEEVYSVERSSRGVEKLRAFQRDTSVAQVTRGVLAEIDVQDRVLIALDEKAFVEAEFEKNRQAWGLPHNFAFKEGDPFFEITFVPGNHFYRKPGDVSWANFKNTAIQKSESMQKRVKEEGIFIQLNLCFDLCTTRD